LCGTTLEAGKRIIHVPSDTFKTISEAVVAASAGDCILVRGGKYQEKILLNKPISIIGERVNGLAPCVEWNGEGSTIKITTKGATIKSLDIRCVGKEGPKGRGCVGFSDAHATIENCDISSAGCAMPCNGVGVCGKDSDIVVRGCTIHDCSGAGIVSSTGILNVLDSTIVHNAHSGVSIKCTCEASIRNCQIFNGNGNGVHLANKFAEIVDNQIYNNSRCGISIEAKAFGELRRNNIFGCGLMGVAVAKEGKAIVDSNVIYDNMGEQTSFDPKAMVDASGNVFHRN
jgi:parallel beta-helix repeat protein